MGGAPGHEGMPVEEAVTTGWLVWWHPTALLQGEWRTYTFGEQDTVAKFSMQFL